MRASFVVPPLGGFYDQNRPKAELRTTIAALPDTNPLLTIPRWQGSRLGCNSAARRLWPCPLRSQGSPERPRLSPSDTSAFVELPVQNRVLMRERAGRLVAAQAAGVHLQLGVQVVGVVEDEHHADDL